MTPTTTHLTRRRALGAIGAAAVTGALAPAGLASSAHAAAPPSPAPARRWRARAAAGQRGLIHYFGAAWPQVLHNTYPTSPGSDDQFHYWWLAHAVDARLDGHLRTGSRDALADATRLARAIRHRNDGRLVNDYFDDMGWYALALHRLWRIAGRTNHLDDAVALWEEIATEGWNETYGPSVAWRRDQLDYKNAPSNGPFAILSYRLHADTGDGRYLSYADAAVTWLRETLLDPDSALVADGINRLGDGAIDQDWIFTYCQGVWVGALVEAFRVHGDASLLAEATRTATAAVRELGDGGVFRSEGQGDGGLFAGIYYRYVWELLNETGTGGPAAELAAFIRTSTDALWESGNRGGRVLAGPDWTGPASATTDLSTQLSAVMALEVRASLEESAGSR
ncbi:glycoside hydrolase family 76 protein [Georgenia deserti]|uniref:Glycoside hydrolase family 76 protein n=1 Tax=Georgenia deserti TaxID=2093781 RepID=A0ABW4L571_9MICO